MNTPLSNQASGGLHTSRRRVQAQVVTLERVQQSVPASFNLSHVVKQQHPRFHSHDSTLVPIDYVQVEVEGMRGVLESCWDLSPPATATTKAPPQQQQQTFNIRHAQLQRLRRSRGDHVITHAAPGAALSKQRTPQRRVRGRPTSSAQAAPARAVQHEQDGSSSSSSTDQHTYRLQVLMELWHLYTTHVDQHSSAVAAEYGHRIPLPKAPCLLTAEQERVLGSIIQQHRKLKQLYAQCPDVAAAAFPGTPSSSSSKPDKRHRWPPELTPADVSEVTQLPEAWRTLLPTLAAQATELLVVFNVGLVMFMLERSPHVNNGAPQGDLITAGLSGLRLAAQRYDPDMGTRFSTVATMWISQGIQRSSVTEAGKVFRRPEHHLQMVNHVLVHHGIDALNNIENRPDVAAEVAQLFRSTIPSVTKAIRATREQHGVISLEAAASSRMRNSDGEPTVWANLLTTADLDEDEGQIGAPGEGSSISGGAGMLAAAAGQVPSWAQAGVRSLQQQQQGASSSGSASRQQVAAAAQKLVQLGVSSATSSVTGTMLDSVDDSEGVLQYNMQQMLHILAPIERRVIETLYGLDQDRDCGLGVELPPVDLGGVSSSSGVGSGNGRRKAFQRASSSSSSSSSGYDSLQLNQGRNPPTFKVVGRGVSTLQEVAAALEIGSSQTVANIRNTALGKLAAAAQLAAGGSQADRVVAAAGSRSSSTSTSSSADNAPSSAAEEGSSAPRTYQKEGTMQMIERLRSYVAEFGHLPDNFNMRYQGKLLGRWMSRVRTRYWQGKLAPLVIATIEQLVPIWDWGESAKAVAKSRNARQAAKKRAADVAAGNTGELRGRGSMWAAAAKRRTAAASNKALFGRKAAAEVPEASVAAAAGGGCVGVDALERQGPRIGAAAVAAAEADASAVFLQRRRRRQLAGAAEDSSTA